MKLKELEEKYYCLRILNTPRVDIYDKDPYLSEDAKLLGDIPDIRDLTYKTDEKIKINWINETR